MKLESDGFPSDGFIPDKFAHLDRNLSPPRRWSGVPGNAQSLAIIVDDPDAPGGRFVHWIVYNIPPATTGFKEGASSGTRAETRLDGALQGKNGFGDIGYDGPQPPSGTHRYFFHLYALDTKIDLAAGATRSRLDAAMRRHIIFECEYMGKYRHRG